MKDRQIEQARSVLLFVIILTLLAHSSSEGTAIESRHAGLISVDAVLNTNTSIWTFNGHAAETDVEIIHNLAKEGIKIMHIQNWWNEIINNPLDIYYNETFQDYAKEELDFDLHGIPVSYLPNAPSAVAIDPNDLWGITLGDEEPAWINYVDISSAESPEITKYNGTYFDETGYYMKPISMMNRTEENIYIEWLNAKSTWVYSFLYDYVKTQAPNARVFQYTMMHPVWGLGYELAAPYEIKADGFAMDCYYAMYNPWLLYETIRRYKASMPGKEFHMDIWATIWDFINEAGDGLYYKDGSYEQIRREAWLSYLSGVDVLGWFDWSPQNNDSFSDWNWGPGREDIMGKRIWRYVDNLAGQLTKLPTMAAKPEILVVGTGYQTGIAMQNIAEVGLFSEYDLVNQRCFAKSELDLSQYVIVLLTDGWYYDETIQKLNAYVESGGNLILLGGIHHDDQPFPISNSFQIELNSNQTKTNGYVRINITRPNILDLELYSDAPYHSTYMIQADNNSPNFYPINGFYHVGENNTESMITDNPLLLYHNESNTESGWILYFGAERSSTLQGETWETYDNDKQYDLWSLYREVVRAFGQFLGGITSITNSETENMLTSHGLVDDNTILAGVMNFDNNDRSFTFGLDLSRFNLPSGNYWVHSLDENRSIGRFQTNDVLLSFGTDITANGTRLFLISEEKPNPNYSINIFPPIPSKTDVMSHIPPTDDNLFVIVILAGTTIIGGAIIVLVQLNTRKRKKTSEKEN
ncbi:MAG: hypothetical protein ACFFFG_05360 [Candidatus Thorarchaeota archaeon]